MKKYLHALSGGLGCLILATSAVAQTPSSAPTTPAPATPAGEKTVVLTPFEVRAEPVGPYQVSDALVGGRLRTDLFESSSSISIITKEFMDDIAPRDIFSAAKYLAGIANNSSQVAGDRVSIRGFQVSSPNIDGFATPQSVVKQDPALYERIEFVRGPDALLAPSGSPGGTLNLISKTARFEDFGSATAQFGVYDANTVNFDVNRTISKKAAFRVAASYIDDEQGKNQGFHSSFATNPSVLINLAERTKLLLQFTYFWGRAYNYLGFPIDPATSATSGLKMLPGLDVYQSSYADDADDPSSANHSIRTTYRALLTTQFNDNLSMRLSARFLHDREVNNQWNLTGNLGGGVNPNNGEWTPGIVWSGAPGFAPSPAPTPSHVYSLSQSPNNLLSQNVDFQNDYVYHVAGKGFDSETVTGVAAETFTQRITGYNGVSPAIDVFNIPAPATYTVNANPSANQKVSGNWVQVYLSEKLKLWNNRIILNAGVVPTWFHQRTQNYISGLTVSNHPDPIFVNYGATFVATPNLAFYFGHSEDGVQIVNAPTATNPNPPQMQSGEQDEVGIRLKFLEGRLTANLSYYDLQQTNNAIVNPLLFSVPPPAVAPPPILADRTAKGWEFELNYTVSKQLSVLANYTKYENRSPYNVRFRADPEEAGAFYVNYRFTEGGMKGLALGLGYTFQGKAAGDSVSGVTAASTPTNQIAVKPSFYLPSYGLLNLTASYKFDDHWTARAFIDNALDEEYFAGSLNRNAVMPGIPTNFRASVTYSF